MRPDHCLEFHALFETTRLLPEKPFPGWETRRFKERVFQNSLDTTQGPNDISSVGVEIPQFAIVPLTCPPEWVGLHQLVKLEFGTGAETLIEAESNPILLEECVDTWQRTVPTVLQILQGASSVLLVGL